MQKKNYYTIVIVIPGHYQTKCQYTMACIQMVIAANNPKYTYTYNTLLICKHIHTMYSYISTVQCAGQTYQITIIRIAIIPKRMRVRINDI